MSLLRMDINFAGKITTFFSCMQILLAFCFKMIVKSERDSDKYKGTMYNVQRAYGPWCKLMSSYGLKTPYLSR